MLGFRETITEAAGQLELTRLFDYVDAKGKTFVASAAHIARFQSYVTEGDFNGDSQTLSLANPSVHKVYKGLLSLQKLLTAEVYAFKSISRPRTPPAMGTTYLRWGEPMALSSKGAKETENLTMPSSAFPNQALHCDFNPIITKVNAAKRRQGTPTKLVPYSGIIKCSPEDAIISLVTRFGDKPLFFRDFLNTMLFFCDFSFF